MPQSLANILVHLVFSTKNRAALLRPRELRLEMFAYLANQEEHHRTVGFQDEFRNLCSKNGIGIDERYVWD